MFFNQSRDQLRQMYVDAWQKRRDGVPLEPVEHAISEVIEMHPEYHAMLESSADVIAKDYLPEHGETNPFLHMGLHMGIREQLATGRPTGIKGIYQNLVTKFADSHAAEHAMMDCLAEMMWQAQRSGQFPDEHTYLRCLKRQTRSR